MAKYTSTPFGVKTQAARSNPDKTQVALTYDILSEGEIEGLSDGLASVFLNDVPVIDKLANEIVKIRRTTVNTTAGSNQVTSSEFGEIRTLSHNNLSGKALGQRQVVIEKAGATTAVASGTAGSTTLTTSSSFFTATMINGIRTTKARGFIRIEGAGPNGSTLVTGANFVSGTEITLHSPIATTVSNTNLHVDLVASITLLTGNVATLSKAPQVSLTGTSVMITGASIEDTKLKSLFNIDNFQFGLRGGTMTQSPLILDTDFGQSSTISSPGIEMLQNNLRANVGTTGNLHTGYNNELDEPSQSEGTAADTLLTAAFLGVSNPSEVDEVHLTFNFPSCHALKSSSGAKGASFVELQMFFEYSTDGGASYTSELAFGPSNSQLLTRPGGLGSRNVNFHTRNNNAQPNNGYVKPTSPQYSAFSEEFVINTEQFQPYDNWRIRVRRINDLNYKDKSFRHTNPCVLSTVESIVKDKLRYPHTAYAAISFNAKDFNSQLPERAYTLKGKKIQVPTNYLTREETGGAASYTRNVSSGANAGSYQNWDGNFRGDETTFNVTSINHTKVFCDNPVWIFYDLLINERYGIGQFIDKSQIDIYELFRIAKYCDEEVPDGNGGTEPRFTCNVYLSKAAEATNVLKQFASIFRGIALWNEGNLTLTVDRPKQPVYNFSKANVLGGAFTYEGTGDRVRTNQVKVTWNDPDDNFRQSTEYVEDYESIADTGRIVRSEQLAFGCTSRGQAHRLGKWKLLSEQNENETISFSTSINATGLKPGDIVLVQDSDKDRSSYAGRVSNTGTRSTTVIPLDRTISLPSYNSNFKPELHLVYPGSGAYLQEETAVIGGTTFFEGDLITSITSSTAAANAKDDSNNPINVIWSENIRVEKQHVTTSAGNVNSLTVASAFTAVPDAEVMWALKLYNTDGTEKVGTAKEYRILSVKEEDKMQFDIVASRYFRNKFLEVERGYKLAPRPTKTAPDPEDVIPAPSNLIVNVAPEESGADFEEVDGNITGYQAIITWDYPTNADGSKFKFCNGFEVEHNFTGETLSRLVGSNEQAITVPGIKAGDYLIRIRTKSTINTVSTFLQREITITSKELMPPTKSRLEQIQRGGEVNQTISLAANGTISLGSSTYTMTSPDGSIFSNTNSNSATHTQAFAGMGASAEAFLLFDTSESTDRLKAIQVHTDTSSNPEVNFIKEVGASNNGLTAGSGTIQMDKFSNQVNGTGTSFESDFTAGDLFKIDGGSSTTRTTAGAITDSITVTLSSANSNIKVGQTVTGSGIVGSCHVAAISGTSLTLSNQQTISNGVTLTFTPLSTFLKVRFVESDTLIFLDEITQRPYNEASYFKQSFIPDTNSDFILAKITTDGSTAYSLAEQFVTSAPADSPQFVKGNVYFQGWNGISALPGTPSASAFVFSTKSLTGLTNGWSQSKPLPPYAVSGFTFREGDGSVGFDTVRGVSSWVRLPPDDFRIEIDDTNRRIKIRPDVNDTGFDQVTSATQLFNDRITTNADGTINYDGTTAVAPNINDIVDSGNTKTGAARGFAGLAANGDVDRPVPTGKGGTGETNTNKFLNSGLSISQGNLGVFTLGLGDGTTDTTTITKSKLNLDYFDGANKAEFDTLSSTDGAIGFKLNNAGSFTQLKPFADAEITKLTNLRAGKNPSDNTKSILNNDISISSGAISGIGAGTGAVIGNDQISVSFANQSSNTGRLTINPGSGVTNITADVSKSTLGLSYDDGATVGAIAGTNLKDSGGTTLNDVDVRNDDLDIDTSTTTLRIKKGSTVINSTTLNKGSVGLSNLDSLEAGTGTKLSSIAAGATVGAVTGTNLKAADGITTLGDNDVKNDALDVDITGTAIKLKIGSTETSTVTATQGLVGLSGVENNATAGATAGVNLKRNNSTVIGDSDIITSEGTSDDTNNVNSVASTNVTPAITAAQNNAASIIQGLADGTQQVTADAITTGSIATSLLTLSELLLETQGTTQTGSTLSFGSFSQSHNLGTMGTGAGFYVGMVHFDNISGSDIRKGSMHIDIKDGASTIYTDYVNEQLTETNFIYGPGNNYSTAERKLHMQFGFFYTGTGTLTMNAIARSQGSSTMRVGFRSVKFGAEVVSFSGSIGNITSATAGAADQESGAITASGFTGSKTISLSGHSSGEVEVNNSGTFASSASITSGQTFKLRLDASSTAGTTRSVTATLGTASITFSVTTAGSYSSGFGGGGSGGAGSGGGGFQNETELR